jgi:hypothetical protein
VEPGPCHRIPALGEYRGGGQSHIVFIEMPQPAKSATTSGVLESKLMQTKNDQIGSNRRQKTLMKTPSIKSLILFTALLSGMAFIGITEAQSVISNVYPNGTNLFQPSSTLTFTASSPAGVTNVTVSLTVKSLYTGQSYLKNLTAANGLTITGPNTSLSVSAALTSNTLYSAAIQIADANGSAASQTVSFDTINPSFTWEAEDWDYTDTNTSISGLYIDNPQTNAYRGRATTVEASNNNGPGAYRPSVPGLSTENAGDIPRLPYIGTGMTDYDVGWTDGGEFGNYTRHYPAGTYNLFARASGGNGPRTESTDITVLSGTAVISGTGPYKFGVLGRGWQSYDFMPVTDSGGNLIQITFDGSPSTLQEVQNQASDNINFYMLMPLNTNAQVTTVTISNIYPDGAFQFEVTNKLSFTASSTAGGIIASAVTVQLTATNLLGLGFVTNYTIANGLIVTGDATNISVTAPLTGNTAYTAFIQVNDANGIPASATISFDTVNPAYTWEAEDWDYGAGNFIDNPQTNAYTFLDGVSNVDFVRLNTGGGLSYFRIGLSTEGAGDIPRVTHVGFQDFDVGFTGAGNWGNYTRTYPAGTFNMYVRASRGDGGSVGDAGNVAFVTSGFGTTNQTTSLIGRYGVSSTGNWQKYAWSAVKDTGGNLSRIALNGSTNTLRVTIDGGGHNQNFFMLLPEDTTLPRVSNVFPDGLVQYQNTNKLIFTASSSLGIATNNITLTLNGVNVSSGLVFTGSPTNWTVSYPHLLGDSIYTATINVRNNAGATYTQTYSFNTINPNYYQWESADWNYTSNGVSGRYIDNPQINAYRNLASAQGIDEGQSNANALNNPYNYRTYDNTNLTPSQEPAATTPRPQFLAAGQIDYKADYVEFGTWMDYTRHYPAGTYYVYGTFTEGQSDTTATLSRVTSSPAAGSQTTVQLGTFRIPLGGWTFFSYVPLTDSQTNMVAVTFDGSESTLQFGGNPGGDGVTINTGFFMLIPVSANPVTLSALRSGGNVVISFPTRTVYHYQVQYKNTLADPSWTSLGSPITGNGLVQSASDPIAGGSRFYRVKIQ